MPVPVDNSPAIAKLAWRLETDIRSRGIQPGDRYLTTKEAGHMLGVSASTANRALRVLAKQNLIERRQRVGTVVGEGITSSQSNAAVLDRIEVLLASDLEADFAAGELLSGIQQIVPRIDVHVNYLPTTDPASWLRRQHTEAAEAQRLVGYLAVSSPREVYSTLAALAAPAVVLGSLWPDVQSLPSVECDNAEMGRLCVEHAIARRRTPMAFLALESWHPGDNVMLDAMMQTLASHHEPANALVVRSIPLDRAIAHAEVRNLLAGPRPPRTLVCRQRCFADTAAQAVREAGLRVGADVTIICDAFALDWARHPLPYAILRGCDPYSCTVVEAARLLLRVCAGERDASTQSVILPVTLDEEPKRSAHPDTDQ